MNRFVRAVRHVLRPVTEKNRCRSFFSQPAAAVARIHVMRRKPRCRPRSACGKVAVWIMANIEKITVEDETLAVETIQRLLPESRRRHGACGEHAADGPCVESCILLRHALLFTLQS